MKTDKIEDIFTLSPIQQGMLFHILADADSKMYYEQEVCRLRGEMNLSAFRFAWEVLIERHQMLRTFFAWNNLPHPVQIVRTEIELPFEYNDLSELDKDAQQSEIQVFLQADIKKSANIDEFPLFNLQLFKIAESEYVFVFSIHHLIHDAWSFAILLAEFSEIYAAKIEHREMKSVVCETYKNYVGWLKKQDFGEGLKFWRSSLKNYTEKMPLPIKKSVSETARTKNLEIETGDVFGKEERFLSFDTSAKFFEKARGEGVTPNIIFQSLWAILTAHSAQSEKAIFGVTVAGRPVSLSGVERIVGNFINTLPLGVAINRAEKLSDLWQKLQKHQAQASLYEHIPLTEIAAACGRKTGEEMFESILVYQNFARELQNKSAANLRFESFRTFGHPNYPLTLRVTPFERFFVELIYDERICAPESVVEIAEILSGLCDFVSENENLFVGDVLKQITSILKEKRKTETLNKKSLFAKKLSSIKAVSAVTATKKS